MDLGTIIGVVAGFFLIVGSILITGTPIGLYIDPGSFVMVLGGSFAAVMVANPMSRVLGIMRYVNLVLRTINYEKEKIIQTLVAFSEQARREGLLALEDGLDDVEDQFMQKGIRLVVDGTDPDIIKSILFNDLNQIQERHETGIKVMEEWGKLAPAFGMIGTLAGLIAMMSNLEDTSAIGRGMGLALITTFYGAIFANLVLIPFKGKLEDRNKDEVLVKEIMIEGILSIQSGDNPRMLEEKLLAFLPPSEREAVRQQAE